MKNWNSTGMATQRSPLSHSQLLLALVLSFGWEGGARMAGASDVEAGISGIGNTHPVASGADSTNGSAPPPYPRRYAPERRA